MSLLTKLTSRSAIERAMADFDRLGRAQFLKAHGFGRARDYFIEDSGHYYDSEAIAAVAYGIENPTEGPLRSDGLSDGELTVKIVLERLNVRVVPNPYRYLVLAENEIHARSEFAKWQDVTGERYHYPNNYRNTLVPGREFIYYKGAHRAGGRHAMPEYFGWGRIGAVYPDPTTMELPKSRRQWMCDIEDYREFSTPVPFRQSSGRYREIDSAIAPQRHWAQGVREITDRAFLEILEAAGIKFKQPASTVSLPAQTVTVIETPLALLATVTRRESSDGALTVTKPPSRRSGRAKAIGDIGEQIFLKWLIDQTRHEERHKIVWVAKTGATPGWDIESRLKIPHQVYEIKATNGERFPAIEITANEWAAAKELRECYNLVLITECESAHPRIQIINDPWRLFEQKQLHAEPTSYRIVRVEQP